ncbi:MAG: hypothetical protein QNJ38_20450 [Prochloraceae cyanobacterium]|nr:hypothetical protein [Prochloraceae cyanobacterium]
MNFTLTILKILSFSGLGFIILAIFGAYLNWEYIGQIDLKGLRSLFFPGLASYFNYLSIEDLISKNLARILILGTECILGIPISLYLGK